MDATHNLLTKSSIRFSTTKDNRDGFVFAMALGYKKDGSTFAYGDNGIEYDCGIFFDLNAASLKHKEVDINQDECAAWSYYDNDFESIISRFMHVNNDKITASIKMSTIESEQSVTMETSVGNFSGDGDNLNEKIFNTIASFGRFLIDTLISIGYEKHEIEALNRRGLLQHLLSNHAVK